MEVIGLLKDLRMGAGVGPYGGMSTSKPFDWKSPLPDTIRGLELWLSEFETDHMYGPSGGFKIASDEAEKWKKAADATAKLKDLHQMRDMAVSDEHLMNLLRGPVAMNWTSLTGLVARIIVCIRARGMKPLPAKFVDRALSYFLMWNLLRVQGHIMHPGGGVFSKEGAVPTLEDEIKAVGGRELSQWDGPPSNRDPLKESVEWNKRVSDFLDTMKTVVVRKDGK